MMYKDKYELIVKFVNELYEVVKYEIDDRKEFMSQRQSDNTHEVLSQIMDVDKLESQLVILKIIKDYIKSV